MEGTTATPLSGIQRTSIGPIDCITQGWGLVSANFGPSIALIVIFYGAMFIPYGSLVLMGPAMCGVYYVFFKWMRGEPASVKSIFKGFEWMWDAFLATILMVVGIYALTLPPLAIVGLIFFRIFEDALTGYGEPDPVLMLSAVGSFYLLFFVLMMLISMLVMFVFPLITERGVNPFQALVWSVKGVVPHLPGLLALHLINGMISGVGFMMCIVPGILYMPVALASTAFAFRKIYGLADRPAYRDFEERDAADARGEPRASGQGGWTPLSAAGQAAEPVQVSPVPPPPAASPSPHPSTAVDERPATERMAARGGGFGSDAGPGDPLPPPPRSSTIVQTRDELPSPRVELRKATVVVPPGGLPAAGAEAEPSTPSTLAPPEVDEPAAPKEPAEPDKPMTVEELGAAQTRLMDNNPFLSEDE